MQDKNRLRSMKSLCGLENADIRNVFKGMGYSDDDLTTRRPVIGIANSWNTLIPGHINFNQISEQVKKGIHRAGGMVCEFGVIGICDALAKNNVRERWYGPAKRINLLSRRFSHDLHLSRASRPNGME